MAKDLWIFAYGSLMWNPGFTPAEQILARAQGFQRGFFMRSVHYRGTKDVPGLVLALDICDQACCDGMALRVADGEQDQVLAYLRERELISYAYYEHVCTVQLADGREVDAVTYVVARDHAQYSGELSLAAQADIILQARGTAGPNRDYLASTVASLRALGIEAVDMFALEAHVQALSISQK